MPTKTTKGPLPNNEVLDWASRQDDIRYVRHYAKSVELILDSHRRGMSKAAMLKIWPQKLIVLVLGSLDPK